MKLLQINSLCDMGSTGKICTEIKECFEEESGNKSEILYFWGKKSHKGIKCSNLLYQKIQAVKARITGKYGFTATVNSLKVINHIKRLKPDVVHLHNIHDHTVNVKVLFSYLNSTNIKVVWTLHDCWAFTGYCAHFTMVSCSKWKQECYNCIQRKRYSWFFDKSLKLYKYKKKAFENNNMIIVTPSAWLATLVKESFLKHHKIITIYNGIDLDIFKPTESNIRERFGISDNDNIILGVAYTWDLRKGIDVFVELSKVIDEKYKIVLVGIDYNLRQHLPSDIISIEKTNSKKELAEIYSTADVFVNPTREEVLGMVNLEALACGTPVITFNTGGSPECINEKCGSVVECNDIEGLCREIERICIMGVYSKNDCVARAQEFDKRRKYLEYIELYDKL